MNAQTTHPDTLTQAAIQNAPVLRAIAEADDDTNPLITHLQVATAAGAPAKNMKRTLDALIKDGLLDPSNEDAGRSYRLTGPGHRALLALEVWEGRVRPGADNPAGAADVLALPHTAFRANPLQPRKAFDQGELEQLKATIVAAGDVLHPLIVFPPDADGVRSIFDGERRWRAVGELIAEGVWPMARPLRAMERANTPGQVAFLGLSTNTQVRLSNIEQARAYEALVVDTGWSARNAALQTGRDPRTVQEMLKVLREATPDDIARHEANPETFTWEALRESVRAPRAAEEPEQGDIEEVERGGDETPSYLHRAQRFSDQVKEVALAEYRARPGNERAVQCTLAGTVTAEGEAWPAEPSEKLRTPWEGYPRVTITLSASDRGRWYATVDTQAGGPAFSGQSGPWRVYTNDVLWPTRADALAYAADKAVAQLGEEWGRKRKLTAWLADLTGGGVSKPQPVPGPPLSPVARLALAELAHKAQAAGKPHAWVEVRKYWLHQEASDLKSAGLIAISHVMPNGPHAQVTSDGQAAVDAIGVALNGGGLTVLRQRAGASRVGEEYATAWLNVGDDPGDAGAHQVTTSEIVHAMNVDEDEEQAEADACALADVRAWIAEAPSGPVGELMVASMIGRAGRVADILERLGVVMPLHAQGGDNAGGIFDAHGEEVATVDVNREGTNPRAQTLALLLALGLNTLAGHADAFADLEAGA